MVMEFNFSLRSWCILLFLVLLRYSVGDYNCRRNGFSCKNGGTCNPNGTCLCPSSHVGFVCSVEADSVQCSENPCDSNGFCYDVDKCFCLPEFYGERCQYKTVTSECLGSEIQMTYVTPDVFEGDVYVRQDKENCRFNQIAAEVNGYKKYVLTIPFETDDVCSRMVNSTINDLNEGEIIRNVDVLISYNPLFISNTDEIIIYRCVHKGSNYDMFAALDDVDLNERSNLTQSLQSDIYLPVELAVLDKDGFPLEKPLLVGESFKLVFFLSDTNVYATLQIEYCVANNTLSESPIYIKFIEDGCPTDEGKNILVNPEGPVMTQYTRPGTSNQLPASELLLSAIKFSGTDNLGFNCSVQICKEGDEYLCQTRDCTSQETYETEGITEAVPMSSSSIVEKDDGTSDNLTVRRKRSSTHARRKFFSAIITVYNAERQPHSA